MTGRTVLKRTGFVFLAAFLGCLCFGLGTGLMLWAIQEVWQ